MQMEHLKMVYQHYLDRVLGPVRAPSAASLRALSLRRVGLDRRRRAAADLDLEVVHGMAQDLSIFAYRRASFFICGHDARAYYRFGAVRDAAVLHRSYGGGASLFLDRARVPFLIRSGQGRSAED